LSNRLVERVETARVYLKSGRLLIEAKEECRHGIDCSTPSDGRLRCQGCRRKCASRQRRRIAQDRLSAIEVSQLVRAGQQAE